MHDLRRRARDERGFTLIELLVVILVILVILVIGLLAAIAIPSFLNQTGKAVDLHAGAGSLRRLPQRQAGGAREPRRAAGVQRLDMPGLSGPACRL